MPPFLLAFRVLWLFCHRHIIFFFFQAEDGIRDSSVTGVQTCALPISLPLPASGKCAPPTATAPIFTPTAAVRSLRRSPVWPLALASNCATCISPSPAWKISFCTIPEGACANELESLFRHARARRSCRPPQLRGALLSTFFAAADARFHLWRCHRCRGLL